MRLLSSYPFLFALLAATLLVGGCDVFGSSDSDSSPDWVGDWEIIEFAGETTEDDRYYSFTEESLTVVREPFQEDEEGCRILRWEIVNVEDDKVVLQLGDRLETDLLEVDGNNLTGTIVRSNNPEFEDETYEGVSVDGDPKELVGGGCQQSAAKSRAIHPLR
jgi:hypothetical protein